MNTTQLELEIVTPMFLHGHDGDLLEFRPPAFKSLFRYWWRAAQSITDLDTLRREEGELFGRTRQGSPLRMRIPGPRNLEPGTYQPLPHHTGGRNCNNCPDEPCRKNYLKDAYGPDQGFKISLTADQITGYTSIAKLSFLLGGVGNRSRRGFGSIRDTSWAFPNVSALRMAILQTLDSVTRPGQFVVNTSSGSLVSYLGFRKYPVIREIFFGQSTQNFQSLLQAIGQATHDNHDPDDNALGHARGNQRMASPIYVSIQKVGQDYLPIVTQLHWDYSGYRLKDLKKQQKFIDQIIS